MVLPNLLKYKGWVGEHREVKFTPDPRVISRDQVLRAYSFFFYILPRYMAVSEQE